jgi:hypothetical protein
VEDKKKRKGFLSNFTGKKKDDEKYVFLPNFDFLFLFHGSLFLSFFSQLTRARKRASIDEWDLRINSQPVCFVHKQKEERKRREGARREKERNGGQGYYYWGKGEKGGGMESDGLKRGRLQRSQLWNSPI